MLHVLWLIPLLPLLGFAVLAIAAGGWAGGPWRSSARRLRAPRPLVALGDGGRRSWSRLRPATPPTKSCGPGSASATSPRASPSTSTRSPLVMMLVVTCVGFLILLYSDRVHARRRGLPALLRLHEPVHRLDAHPGAGRRLPVPARGLGGRGAEQLPAHRLLVPRRRPTGRRRARRSSSPGSATRRCSSGCSCSSPGWGRSTSRRRWAAAQSQWAQGAAVATAAALLVMGGALGKSAQLPLQTWLPDAMAGPTPVSALIHAATMVTAGVYLIAGRTSSSTLAPSARLVVAVIGAVTLLYAGVSALAQTDIKRVLAYSTISQIGYMFLALGVARLVGGHLPLPDARLLQGPAVPGRRPGDQGHGRRARHPQDGRPATRAPGGLLAVPGRGGVPVGPAAGDGRLLQQGPHHRLRR